MSGSWRISRRTVLRGLGTSIALPWLDAMAPALALAAGTSDAPAFNRMAFIYLPNGMQMPDWTPTAAGADFELPYILEPLKPFKKDLMVLSGLAQDTGRTHGDGPGDHARALASFLTGSHPRKTSGADIRVGVSVDQVAAQNIGYKTKFPSLELGCEAGPQAGNCDSGYSCSYSTNIAWRSETTPVTKEINPRLVFERLFITGNRGDVQSMKHRLYQKSILDFVLEQANGLQSKLGIRDRRKLDEYLGSIREIELRVARAEKESVGEMPDYSPPTGIPKDYAEHIQLMYDLIVLAFQGDLTRVTTFVVGNEGSNRSYPSIGVLDGHHELSHHRGDPEKQAKIREINRFHMEQFGKFVEKLAATRDGDRTLLENSMILYGSGLSDGNSHDHDDLPILLLGRGGGTITSGRHVRYRRETPLNNLFLAMLARLDSAVSQIGDSTGPLELGA